MKQYFVFSDVHGQYDMLMGELEAQGFEKSNPNHILLSLGDLFDRGTQNDELLLFVYAMMSVGRFYNVMGNHDEFLTYLIDDVRKPQILHDLCFAANANGFSTTLSSFSGFSAEKIEAAATVILEHFDRSIATKNYGYFMNTKEVFFIEKVVRESLANYGFFIRELIKNSADVITMHANNKLNYFLHAGLTFVPLDKGEWKVDNWAKTSVFMKSYQVDEAKEHFFFGHVGAHKLRKSVLQDNSLKDFRPFTYSGKTAIDAYNGVSGRINVLKIETNDEPKLYFKKSNIKELIF